MSIIRNIKLTSKRNKKSEKVLRATHPDTINAVLRQAGSIEEFEVLREGLALDDEISATVAEHSKSSTG